MAQMETNARSSRGKRQRLSAFVDLTPMVDLAFLLIAFFMLTTSMQDVKNMELRMPQADPENPELISKERMFTLIAGGNDMLFYYPGDDPSGMEKMSYSATACRELLRSEMKRIGTIKPMVCLIKCTPEANYQNLIFLFDDVKLAEVPTYALQDMTGDELMAIDILNAPTKK
ncbi:MAG: biopolymer transporter ExbD [Chitinophagales bacterium]